MTTMDHDPGTRRRQDPRLPTAGEGVTGLYWRLLPAMPLHGLTRTHLLWEEGVGWDAIRDEIH